MGEIEWREKKEEREWYERMKQRNELRKII